MVEDFFDNILLVITLFFSVIFIALIWREESQNRYMEYVINDFGEQISEKGVLSLTEYEALLEHLGKSQNGFKVELRYENSSKIPYYGYYSSERLETYFAKRNKRKHMEIETYQKKSELNQDDVLNIRLQTKTQGEILANLMLEVVTDAVNKEKEVTAVFPQQRVYVGESLITICRVEENGASYYIAADDICASHEGRSRIELTRKGEKTGAFVDVFAYEKLWKCEQGHYSIQTLERILYEEKNGEAAPCAVCEVTPLSLTISTPVIYLELGHSLSETEAAGVITYMSGNIKGISPDQTEWNDDFDSNFSGIQSVTVEFQGIRSKELVVITQNADCTLCGNRIDNRSLSDQIEYPLCISCMTRIPTFLGETAWENQVLLTEDILACLEGGDFVMSRGGILEITLYTERGHTIRERVVIFSERKEV